MQWPALKPLLGRGSQIRVDLSSDALEALVEVLYGADYSLHFNQSNIDELFWFSCDMNVQPLVGACRKVFNSLMSLKNCVAIWRTGVYNMENTVQEDAFNYILQ